MRVRRLAAALFTFAAAALLSGCVQIKNGAVTQPGTVGALHVSHDLCTGTSPAACSTPLSSAAAADALQVMVAYRVPSWAPDPTRVSLTAGGQTFELVPEPTYAPALVAAVPGITRSGERWVGFRANGSPPFANGAVPSGRIDATFDLPDAETRPFSHFTIVGFRWLTAPGSSAAYAADRAVVCGTPLPIVGGTALSDTLCMSSFWPRADDADTTPSDDGSELVLRNRLQLTAPAARQVQPGERVDLTFSAVGAPVLTGSGTSAPTSVTTTIPGATVTAPATLVLAAGGTVPVQLQVPADTPPGSYSVRVFAGVGVDGRSATATITVPGPPTPTPVPSPSPAASPTPTSAPLTGPAVDLSTFAGSVEAAAQALSAAGAREALGRGKLRIKVRASAKGKVAAELRAGKTLLAKGRVAARRRGLVTVKLKLTAAGTKALAGRSAIAGSLRVRFTPVKGKATTTSVAVTIPTS